jgi:hypothetical protein
VRQWLRRWLPDALEMASVVFGCLFMLDSVITKNPLALSGWAMATFWVLQASAARQFGERGIANLDARLERAEAYADRLLDGVVTGKDAERIRHEKEADEVYARYRPRSE